MFTVGAGGAVDGQDEAAAGCAHGPAADGAQAGQLLVRDADGQVAAFTRIDEHGEVGMQLQLASVEVRMRLGPVALAPVPGENV